MHSNSFIRPLGLAALASTAVLLAACSDSTRSTSPSAAAPAAIGGQSSNCWAFSPTATEGGPGWHPIRTGIAVTSIDQGAAMNVAYRRTRGKAAGVAFHLPAGASERLGTVTLRMSAQPDQRLSVCLTDGKGVVWTLPSIKALNEVGEFTLSAKEIKPDPFQNSGKEVPAQPDWSDMRMLTVLDITGFMGAAEADCSWRIEFVRGEEGER
jgi:hypothetical protein